MSKTQEGLLQNFFTFCIKYLAQHYIFFVTLCNDKKFKYKNKLLLIEYYDWKYIAKTANQNLNIKF